MILKLDCLSYCCINCCPVPHLSLTPFPPPPPPTNASYTSYPSSQYPDSGLFDRSSTRGEIWQNELSIRFNFQDFCRWPDEPFEEMDSTLAVQQYIQQIIRREPSNIELILGMPDGQDEGVWKYEHLRQFCMELNGLAVRLQGECHPQTCTQMTATEQWIFLCAAHKTPKECPAIDYTRHTLDGAACLLNSNKYFPSRSDHTSLSTIVEYNPHLDVV